MSTEYQKCLPRDQTRGKQSERKSLSVFLDDTSHFHITTGQQQIKKGRKVQLGAKKAEVRAVSSWALFLIAGSLWIKTIVHSFQILAQHDCTLVVTSETTWCLGTQCRWRDLMFVYYSKYSKYKSCFSSLQVKNKFVTVTKQNIKNLVFKNSRSFVGSAFPLILSNNTNIFFCTLCIPIIIKKIIKLECKTMYTTQN